MKNLPDHPNEVQAALQTLTTSQVQDLADETGVSAPALLKIKYGKVANPGIFTVFKFWPQLAKRMKARKE